MTEPYHADNNVTLHHGDCLAHLQAMPDNSVDSIVTDPPYGLSNTTPDKVADTIVRWASGDREHVPEGRGFMGRPWDAFVPPPAVWDECLRVLKPGGHMAVFAGSRTQDLMGMSIRLAGFELRDTCAWIYGSGMPKSHNIGKAIDKAAGAKREVIGERYTAKGNGGTGNDMLAANSRNPIVDITAPATPEAERWEGFGTALKPAIEPILVAQKPFSVVPLYEVAERSHHILGALTWLSLSPAKRAGTTSRLNHQGPHEETCASALASAGTDTSRDESAKTDTFRSPGMASTCLSIERLWQSILGAILDPTITFTTSTESSTITVLKTLNSLLAQITSATTMPVCGCLLSGQSCHAPNAVNDSSGSWSNWKATLSVSVPETVIEQTALTASSLLASIVENLSSPGTAVGGGSVLSDAQTGSTIQGGVSPLGTVNTAGSLSSHAGRLGDSAPSVAGRSGSAVESILLCRKPLDGTVAGNVLAHGVGGLNIDACRVATGDKLGRVNNDRNPNDASSFMISGGKGCVLDNSDVRGGRFPANVLLDEHAATEMDKQSGPAGSNSTSPGSRGVGMFGNRTGGATHDTRDSGGASRFFPVFKYQAKAPKKERPVIEREDGTKVQHPTVKPLALMSWLVTLITPPGGVVLDPFAGSGTTLEAARDKGFRAVGVEADAEHCELIVARLAKGDGGLFAA